MIYRILPFLFEAGAVVFYSGLFVPVQVIVV